MWAEKKRPYVIACAGLTFLCVVLALESCRQNSWGKWKRHSALSSCLPLPPPLGCNDHYRSREVLEGEDTDFVVLPAIGCLTSLLALAGCSLVLNECQNNNQVCQFLTKKKSLVNIEVATAGLNFLACLIATFRINVVGTLQRRQGVFGVSGLTPSYSTSYFLCIICILLSLGGAWLLNHVLGDAEDPNKRLSKTIKQHMARNLMYPDDQRSSKMVTFSSMDRDLEEAAAELCVKAVMQFGLEEDIAENIKQSFDAKFGPTWHCAVGANFGSAVQHFSNEYIEVAMPQLSVLLFRCDTPDKPLS